MRKRLLKYAAYSGMAFIGVYLSAFQRAMGSMTSDLAGGMVLSGTVVSFHFAGVFAGPPVFGELSDRFGRRAVLSGAFLLFLLGLALISLSSGAAALMAGVLLAGAAFGTLEGTLTAALADSEPENGGRVILVSQILLCAGTVAGPFVAGAALGGRGGWRALYFCFMLACVAFALVFGRLKYPDRPTPAAKVSGTFAGRLLREPGFLLLCLCLLLYVGVEEGLAFWMTSYFGGGIPEGYADWALPLFWTGMTAGKFLFMGRAGGSGLFVAICASAASLAVLAVAMLAEPLPAALLLFLAGLAMSGIFPFVMALAGRRYPQYAGTAFGIMLSGCAAGGMLVPFAMGVLNGAAGFRASIALCAALMLCVAALLVFLNKAHPKPLPNG
jgi:FHS family glucose/mannose:H+ symporter-like MFS transporter